MKNPESLLSPEPGASCLEAGRPFQKLAVFLASGIALCCGRMAPSAWAQQTVNLTANPTRITVPVNASSTSSSAITVTIAGGAAPVTLAVSGLPPGAQASFDTASFTASGTANLTVTTANLAQGEYELAIQATGGAEDRLALPLIAGHVWSGAGSKNWSDAANWVAGVVPGASDDVVFSDLGALPDDSGTSVIVGSSQEAASLRFKHGTIRNHNIEIRSGAVLAVTGEGGFYHLRDELPAPSRSYIQVFGGGALVISNANANFAMLNDNQQESHLYMDNLDNFVADVSRIGIGDYTMYPNYGENGNSDHPRRFVPKVLLAKTNYIRATFTDTNSWMHPDIRNYSFVLGRNERQGTSARLRLDLGRTNAFLLDSVCFIGSGAQAASGSDIIRFNTSLPAPRSAYFRGPNGGRMSMFAISDAAAPGASGSGTKAIVDFSGGSVDALVDKLYISRERAISTDNASAEGTMTLAAGVFDVNTAILGFQGQGNNQGASSAYCRGTLNVNGSALFVVNETLELGHTTASAAHTTTAESGYGQLNINGGTVQANRITVGGVTKVSVDNNISILGKGSLVVSNTVGAADARVKNLTINNGTLTLHVDGARSGPYVYVSSLVTPGAENIIKIASVTRVASFPAQIPLISYESAAPNLSVSLPAGMFGFVVVNDAQKTIDVILSTTAPKNLVWRGNVNGNWDTTTANWVDAQTLAPATFSNGDFVTFDDSATGSTTVNVVGTIISGQSTTTPGVTISNSVKNYTLTGGTIAGTGAMRKAGPAALVVNATSENSLTIVKGSVSGSGAIGLTTLEAGGSLSFTGAIGGLTSFADASSSGTINGPVSIQGGAFVNSGTVTTTPGTLTIASGATVSNLASGVINVWVPTGNNWSVAAGATLANFGVINNLNQRLNLNGLLFGTGKISDQSGDPAGNNGRIGVNPGATFSPGESPTNSIGTFTLENRLDLNPAGGGLPAGRLVIEVDLNHPAKHDVIAVDKWSNIRGTIVMSNIGSVPFAAGQSFLIVSNNFGIDNTPETARLDYTIEPARPGPGLMWQTNQLILKGILGVIQAPVDATPTNLVLSASGNNITFSWPASHTGWQLLVQTNNLSTGVSANRADWAVVPGSESVNQVTRPINSELPAEFFRLVLP